MVAREINVPNVPNFRGLGGYTTNDGRRVRPNLLYRSAKLNELTAEGYEVLRGLCIKTIVDFRDDKEVFLHPTPSCGIKNIKHIPILSGNADEYLQDLILGKLAESDIENLMCHLYKDFSRKYSHQFALFFELLLSKPSYPILFHCTAGKDRTGFAAAILLSLLGVPFEAVKADYLLSNTVLSSFNEKHLQSIPKSARNAVQPLLAAKEEYLAASFSAIIDEYGSIASYAEKALGLSEEKQLRLQSLLLEE